MRPKINLRAILAILLMVGVIYWGFDSIRPRSYSGSNLSFDIGSGSVVITNPSDEAIPVLLRADSRSGNFVITSDQLELEVTRATRQGSGRNVAYELPLELPPGATNIQITSGAGVRLVTETDTRLEATVTPLRGEEVRNTLIFAIIVILGAAFYLSNTTGHQWIKSAMRRREAAREELTPQKTA